MTQDLKDKLFSSALAILLAFGGFLFNRYENTISGLEKRLDKLEDRVNNHTAHISSLQTLKEVIINKPTMHPLPKLPAKNQQP